MPGISIIFYKNGKAINIMVWAFMFFLMGPNISIAAKESVLENNRALFELEINQICDTSQEAITVQLIGINNPVLYDEFIIEDTVYLLIKDIEGHKYRDPSLIKCPGDSFYILIVFAEDTAGFLIERNTSNWNVSAYRPAWFLELEPLKDLPGDVISTHIIIDQGKKNQYTIGRVMRHLNKQVRGRGELIYPDDGLYRCLPRIHQMRSGHYRWCETYDGIVIFIRMTDSDNEADAVYIKNMLDSLDSLASH